MNGDESARSGKDVTGGGGGRGAPGDQGKTS